jgi:hypothetical protein
MHSPSRLFLGRTGEVGSGRPGGLVWRIITPFGALKMLEFLWPSHVDFSIRPNIQSSREAVHIPPDRLKWPRVFYFLQVREQPTRASEIFKSKSQVGYSHD